VTVSGSSLRWWIGALCLSLLLMRLSGAHLHLCFDGSEPPVSYHLVDSGIHHGDEHGTGEAHSDQDMPVAKDAAVKKSSAGDAALLFCALVLLLFLFAPGRQPRPAALPVFHGRHLSRLRPPLRGPPSPA
jgi:hypothetical protein